GITVGARKLQAMALAETRIERLRVAAYHTLLTADLDGDGVVNVGLKDSGSEGDAVADDGEYTTRQASNGIMVTWTVRPDRPSRASCRERRCVAWGGGGS